MSKINKFARHGCVFAIVTILALSSCSSGDDNSTSSGGIPTKPVAINLSNALFVASQSSAADEQKDNASSVIDEGNNLNSNTSANTGQRAANVLKSLANRSESISDNITAMGLITCPVSGTYTYPDGTVFGDYIYDNCTFYFGYTVNGSISITGSGELVDRIWTSFNGSYSYNELSITTSGDTYVYDGTMNIVYSNIDDVIDATHGIPSFTYTFGDEAVRLSGYLLDFHEAGAEGWFTYHYKLSSTILGGSVYVETTGVFKYYTSDLYDFPYAGQITITGASNSKVRLTVESGGAGGLPTDFVLIEIDANGDDDYENSRRLQWQYIE